MYNEIDKELTRICRAVTKNHELWEDLKQEVFIILVNKGDLEERWRSGTFFAFAYMIAYKQYNLSKSKFYRKHRRHRYIEDKDIDDTPNQNAKLPDEETPEQVVAEIMKHLSPSERLWIDHWLKRNCSVKKLSEDSKISRPSITARLNALFDEIKKINRN